VFSLDRIALVPRLELRLERALTLFDDRVDYVRAFPFFPAQSESLAVRLV